MEIGRQLITANWSVSARISDEGLIATGSFPAIPRVRERTICPVGETDKYILGYRNEEQDRLTRQARELAGEAGWLLDQVGPLDGARVLELGCGPHGCLDLLADRVGPAGSVVGLERNEDAVRMARAMIQDRGLSNVEVLVGDARDSRLGRASFDAVTARLVLVNVPHCEEILAEAIDLVRPGGKVAWHEAAWPCHTLDPPLPAWDRLFELFQEFANLNHMDLFVARRLPRLLREGGLADVDARAIIHVYPPGNGRRTLGLDFVDNIAERFVAANLIGADELAQLRGELARHLDDPGTFVISCLFVQAWGRKPA